MATRRDQDKFGAQLRETVNVLESRIKTIASFECNSTQREEAIKVCLSRIGELRNEVKQIAPSLPAHAQRTYAETITRLSEEVQEAREAGQPKKKFSFKRQPKAGESLSTNDDRAAQATEGPSTTSSSFRAPSVPAAEASKPINAQAINISSLSNARYVLKPSDSQNPAFAALSELDGCVIDVSTETSHGHPHAGLTSANIKRSLVICGVVRGPIHLTNQLSSVVLVDCQQFRMHESHDCDVYLQCGNRPIIEACSNVRFAPWPEELGLFREDKTRRQNRWDQVDDFLWLKTEPSPNWTVLPEESRLSSQTWMELMCPERENVPGLLAKAGIR